MTAFDKPGRLILILSNNIICLAFCVSLLWKLLVRNCGSIIASLLGIKHMVIRVGSSSLGVCPSLLHKR